MNVRLPIEWALGAEAAERLRKLESSLNPDVRRRLARAKELALRAKPFPELVDDPQFKRALAKLKLNAMEALIEAKERASGSVVRACNGRDVRKELRQAAEAENLKREARKGWMREEDIAACGNNLQALRALVQRARIRQQLHVKAARALCVLVTAPHLEAGNFDAAKAVILVHEQLLEAARRLGVEDRMRSLLLLGERVQAEELVQSVRNASALEQFRRRQAERIEKTHPMTHADLTKLLDQVCTHPFDSRDFRQARRNLDARLFKLGV